MYLIGVITVLAHYLRIWLDLVSEPLLSCVFLYETHLWILEDFYSNALIDDYALPKEAANNTLSYVYEHCLHIYLVLLVDFNEAHL
jgi:hypothetical protein